MLTGEQLRAARALVRMEQAELAQVTGVSLGTIRRLEGLNGRLSAQESTLASIREALVMQGVIFIDDDERGGAGVRLAESGEIERWNAQLETILDEMTGWLKMAIEDADLADNHRLSEAIQDARERTFRELGRTVSAKNTDDMFGKLDREALRKISSPGALTRKPPRR